MNLRENFGASLKDAVKSKDKRRVSTLRLINAAVKDRDIAARTAGEDQGVSDEAILDILAKMVKQRDESVRTYQEAGRMELAEQEAEEIEIIREFMPKQLSEEDVRGIVQEAIAESNASSMKDMGAVMQLVMPKVKGVADGKMVNEIVRELLNTQS